MALKLGAELSDVTFTTKKNSPILSVTQERSEVAEDEAESIGPKKKRI